MTAPTAGTIKSCLDCPSYVPKAETVEVFGKATGAPMCQRFGHLLGTPAMNGAELSEVANRRAGSCDKFGYPRTTSAGSQFIAVIPDPDAREALPDLHPLKQGVRACGMCSRFVPDERVAVAPHLGYTTGLCAAKGKLVPPSKRVEEATGCSFRKLGPVRDNADGLHLIPLLQITARPRGAAGPEVSKYRRHPDEILDPKDYPTDRDVTPEEMESGVRAWRKIVDPEGTGNEVYAPIFDEKYFSEEERALIPKTGDEERPELHIDHDGSVYRIMVLWRELDETPMLWGSPGTGKTEILRHIAWLMQLPFHRVSISSSSEIDDLAGKMLFKDNETTFHYGRISSAWTKPCLLLVDEPNTGPTVVWEFIRPMTDNSKQLVLDMSDDPKPLQRHNECHLGMAANPAWNALNVGTNVIGDADSSRLMHLEFDLPPEEVERAIISNRVRLDGWEIDKERLDFIMSVAGKLRELCSDGILSMTWAIRPQIKVARALRWFSPRRAYRLAVADMLPPEQHGALLDQVEAHIPGKGFPRIQAIEED